MQIDFARVCEAVDDPAALSFDECERRVRDEQQTQVQLRPVEPAVKEVLDAVLARHGRIAIAPMEMLLEMIGADPALAERLARQGLAVN